MGRFHAAVDVGGTFIDVVLADDRTGEVRVAKVLHRPGAQGEDILAALTTMTGAFGSGLADLSTVVLGTTVVTNALLEGRLARTALVTTAGFRDVLEIARMTRPAAYDPHRRRATPVVPRELRFEVGERLGQDGEVLEPLDAASVDAVAAQLAEAGVEAVAVCLLFSFVDARHEQAVRDRLEARLDAAVSLSSDVMPVFREYERMTATAINAASMPLMGRFLDGIAPLVAAGETRGYIMGSSGGCLTIPEARRFPVKCATSGPAGGAIGALDLARRYGIADALTLDVGGTSSDVAMLRGGVLPFTSGRDIGGYPIALSGVEIETIGAGGGSIAFIDPTGLVKVGPRSAGARPGPACYGMGGTRPTVTDAHVALGRLGTSSMLGGGFELDRSAALAAIETEIARPLGLSWQRAALGILDVTTANIVRAVRTMSIERGHDPRRMALIAFGGAGPLHALDVARALEIPEVLVPALPGVWSAVGILSADIQYEVERTWLRVVDAAGDADIRQLAQDMRQDLAERASADGMPAAAFRIRHAVDMRFKGQSHTLRIELGEPTRAGLDAAAAGFRAEHEQRFGHVPAVAVELVNLSVTLDIPRSKPRVAFAPATRTGTDDAERQLWITETQAIGVPVFAREALHSGARIEGPAIIDQYDSTIVLGRGDRLDVLDESGTARIRLAPA